MATFARQRSPVRLLDIEPDLGAFLSDEERDLASRVVVPVVAVDDGECDLERPLREGRAFAAVIVHGIVLQRLVVGEQAGLRLLGPGDTVSRQGPRIPAMISQASCRAAGGLSLALLDERVLLASRRFPGLVAALQIQMGEQHLRLVTQLIICQLPRVADRVLTLMWFLAESWGRVTPAGTSLPLSLTHDAIGELIGAKRPTVSLALKELVQQNAVVRQAGGWLLLKGAPAGVRVPGYASDPVRLSDESSAWRDGGLAAEHAPDHAHLRQTVQRLLERHPVEAEHHHERLARTRATRDRSLQLRAQLVPDAVSRRRAPSA
jgi:CRP/FNR family cyclic AMP-dependent transcriptional regulator